MISVNSDVSSLQGQSIMPNHTLSFSLGDWDIETTAPIMC